MFCYFRYESQSNKSARTRAKPYCMFRLFFKVYEAVLAFKKWWNFEREIF